MKKMDNNEIKDLAYTECLELIKQVVKDEFDIPGIKEDICQGVKDAIYLFLEENCSSIIEDVTEGIKNKVEREMHINFRVVRDD
jgi:hypothetical protein